MAFNLAIEHDHAIVECSVIDSGESHSTTALQAPGFGEPLEATVECLLDIVREAAGRKLVHGQVIPNTVAAHALLRAWIGAVAVLKVLLFLAFHVINQPSMNII